ncbi:adenylyl-sulfate kinase 3-like isoform X1 [Typha angustifolia]|uniref:adenylyl-sulfate kinase 3-like isoform X1 n=1 Tax=Typha angustifolia TaxID=59011 RepID=UPI003C30CBE9
MFALSAQSLHRPLPSAVMAVKEKKKSRNLGFGVGRSRVGYRIAAALPEEDEKRTGLASRRNESRCESARPGIDNLVTSNVGMSTNILWHDCPIGKLERQKLLAQKGCVIWITGLSGSGKSTLACALSRELHCRGYLTYVLDGDNLRHGLNRDLSFKAEDRAENIRRVGEVSKLFADAGVICIACLISPYRKDRDACRALLPDSTFIEVFMNVPLEVCELRDPKGLYKLARSGKIKGFTGIDDPYEPPLDCEIVIQMKDGGCPSPNAMAEQVISYLGKNRFLQA